MNFNKTHPAMNKTFLYINGIKTEIAENETILSAIRKKRDLSLPETPCNGRGTCGKCKVAVISGSLSPLSKEEKDLLTQSEIVRGIRLACMAKAQPPLRPVRIHFKEKSLDAHTVLEWGRMPEFDLKPIVTKQFFDSAQIPEDLKICGLIPPAKGAFTLIRYQGKPIGMEPGETTGQNYGIAVDIGTTTLACSLVDMATGCAVTSASGINPQTRFGGDVLTRIQYARDTGGLMELKNTVVDFINNLSLELIRNAGIQKESVYCYTIAANTTMMHLLLGVNPISLAMAPYKPVFTGMQELPTKQTGFTNCSEFARVCCLPGVSAYIGADIVAGVEISGMANMNGTVLFIDIGTNGEIALSRDGTMAACSCAAGPALEGMNISCGMRAADGAIEHASFGDGYLSISAIGQEEPLGICGSGVLEILSGLLKTGAIDRTGRIRKTLPGWLERMTVREGKKPYFVLNKGKNEIRFTQNDIRQVQLAKGAILSGILALLNAKGLSASQIDKVIVAGQFGRHLSEESLVGAGILPAETAGKIEYIGNSSLAGAILSLLSSAALQRIGSLAGRMEYLELATLPEYGRLFMQCMNFDAP